MCVCVGGGGGAAEHSGSECAFHPEAPGSILGIPRMKNYLDVAETYQRRWQEESGQRLDNVD